MRTACQNLRNPREPTAKEFEDMAKALVEKYPCVGQLYDEEKKDFRSVGKDERLQLTQEQKNKLHVSLNVCLYNTYFVRVEQRKRVEFCDIDIKKRFSHFLTDFTWHSFTCTVVHKTSQIRLHFGEFRLQCLNRTSKYNTMSFERKKKSCCNIEAGFILIVFTPYTCLHNLQVINFPSLCVRCFAVRKYKVKLTISLLFCLDFHFKQAEKNGMPMKDQLKNLKAKCLPGHISESLNYQNVVSIIALISEIA